MAASREVAMAENPRPAVASGAERPTSETGTRPEPTWPRQWRLLKYL